MWNKERVTMVLPTQNNVGTIRYVIEDLYLTGYIDDLMVIDIHSNDNTINEVSYTKARLLSADSIKEAISLGVERAHGSLVIFMDPDGSYPAQEIEKLLAYSNDYDVVFGSRTLDVGFKKNMAHFQYSRKMMDFGYLLSKRYNCPLVTDIDSRVFMIRRIHYMNKRFFLEYDDNFFFLEFVLRTIKNNSKFIQVPLEWRGEFGNKNQLSSFLTSMKYFREVKRIIDDKQPKAVISDVTGSKKTEDKKVEKTMEDVIPHREFNPEHEVYKPKQKRKQSKITKAFKVKPKSNKSKISSKQVKQKKNINNSRNVAKSVVKKARNTSNRFAPDEFS